jgi:ATP-binding cassette subfamily B protein
MKFPVHRQLDGHDCGPTCLLMVAEYYGRRFSRDYLRGLCSIGKGGVSLLGISNAAERIGLRSMAVRISYDRLHREAALPCIVHWRGDHFVVVHRITPKKVWVADPERGLLVYSKEQFIAGWTGIEPVRGKETEEIKGIVLLLEVTPEFHESPLEAGAAPEKPQRSLWFFARYLSPHRKLVAQLFLGMFVGLLLELMFPFITQAVVDHGIGNLDMSLIYLFLAAQVMLSVSQTATGMIRSWIFLHVGSRIGISLVANFLQKLMRLPLSFFETRTAGDIMQRINDHDRVRRFLTSNSLNALFSIFSFIAFAAILALYQWTILAVFLGVTVLSVIWMAVFLKRRRAYDQFQFELDAKEQDRLVQLVHGAQEIKVHGLEKQKRWEWEELAARLFKLEVKWLTLKQLEGTGSFFLRKMRDVFISFLAAKAVIDGEMTLGMMLSTQYMVGQLSGPISDLMAFIHQAQDAGISLERMQQIYHEKDEESSSQLKLQHFPPNRSLTLNQVSFQYPGPKPVKVLDDLSLVIPEGKVTAIVGASGSGKTTLLKLLLGLHQPQQGGIYVANMPIDAFDNHAWRTRFGVVMQDGFIFSDTLARNIACGMGLIDQQRLRTAIEIANLQEFVRSLPEGLDTRIGADGRSLSGGQTQRVLIARAIYKDPEYVLFDEATSALDANNEHTILWNLSRFIEGRTVVVIAHRLSTVRNADQIVVMDGGRVVECGSHQQLIANRSRYYELVKNQLQLENLEAPARAV